MTTITQNPTVSALIKQAQALSPAELAKVSKALDHLVKEGKKTPKATKDIDEELFYNEISSQLKSVIGKQIPYGLFKAKNSVELKNCVDFVNAYLRDILSKKVTRREEKMKFFKVYAQVMISFFRKTEYPLSVKLLINSYESFPGKLENQFPGYISSGLARFILHDEQTA